MGIHIHQVIIQICLDGIEKTIRYSAGLMSTIKD
jgi:hypothetical protein